MKGRRGVFYSSGEIDEEQQRQHFILFLHQSRAGLSYLMCVCTSVLHVSKVFPVLPEVRFTPACKYFITSEIPVFIFQDLANVY